MTWLEKYWKASGLRDNRNAQPNGYCVGPTALKCFNMNDSARLTENALRAFMFAQQEAYNRQHDKCDVDDLFYGIAASDERLTSEILNGAGITHQNIHRYIMAAPSGKSPAATEEGLPLSSSFKRAFELAFEAGDSHRHKKIDCIHILHGLLNTAVIEDLVPLMQALKANTDTLRSETYHLLSYEVDSSDQGLL
ncbi:MAG TPA: Clp protease N-terminal domain-containing protein [Oculatellaceae cyanobacterium]